MIEVKNLSKSYGRKTVFKNLNATFDEGSVHGILGPNGCGKTTLIKSMLGLVQFSGEVLLGGQPLHAQLEKVSWLPQHPKAPLNTTPARLFSFVENLRTEPAVFKEELIREFQFAGELFKPLSALSGGNFQKCFLILTLMFDVPLIILDEPTVGLDPIAAAVFKRILKRRAKHCTVLLISHISTEIYQLSDVMHFLLNGAWVLHGNVAQIQAEESFVGFEEFILEHLSPAKE